MENKAYAITPIVFLLLIILAFVLSFHYSEILEIFSKQTTIESSIFMANVQLQKERMNKENFLIYSCYLASQIAMNKSDLELKINEYMKNEFNDDFQIQIINIEEKNFTVSFIFPNESFNLTNLQANFSEKKKTILIDYPFLELKNASENFNETSFSNCLENRGCNCNTIQPCLNETQDENFYWSFRNETIDCKKNKVFVSSFENKITIFFPRFVLSFNC
jgi:hypothetical protein